MPRKGINIYKRKDGRWEGRILKKNILPKEAKYKYVYGKTYKETKQKMDQTKQEMEKYHTDCNTTMEKAVCLWLTEKRDDWKPSTFSAYHNLTGKYIIPMIGESRVTVIDNEFLKKFVIQIRAGNEETLSNAYLHNICAVVIMVLRHMKTKHHFLLEIPDNPISLHRRREMFLPGEQDLRKLEQYLISHMNNGGTELGILTSLYTGIRIGELCALKWEDIDLNEKVIKIRQNVQRLKTTDRKENTAVIFQTPKTTTSTRIIPIPPVLLPYYEAYKGVKGEFLVKGKKKEFAEPRTMEYRLAHILRECSIEPFHFHMLRHSFATRCMTMGFDIKSLSEILGHSNIQTTLNLYVHSTMTRKKQLMNLLKLSIREEELSAF